MARMRMDSWPEKPRTLRDLDLILRDERYKNLSATSGCEDNIYAGSSLSQDDTLVILLMSRECKEFMRMSTVLFSFTMLFDMMGAPHQYAVSSTCNPIVLNYILVYYVTRFLKDL